MTKVYRVVKQLAHSRFTSWVTENGKVLQTALDYDNGLLGTYILDSCVDIDPVDWQDAQSSIQNLSWWTEEDGIPQSVAEVEYNWKFDEPKVTKNQIGDRKVVTPVELLALMGKPVESAA